MFKKGTVRGTGAITFGNGFQRNRVIGLGPVGRGVMRPWARAGQQVQPAKLGAGRCWCPAAALAGSLSPHLPIHTSSHPRYTCPFAFAMFHFISNLSRISLRNKNSFSISVQMMKTHGTQVNNMEKQREETETHDVMHVWTRDWMAGWEVKSRCPEGVHAELCLSLTVCVSSQVTTEMEVTPHPNITFHRSSGGSPPLSFSPLILSPHLGFSGLKESPSKAHFLSRNVLWGLKPRWLSRWFSPCRYHKKRGSWKWFLSRSLPQTI